MKHFYVFLTIFFTMILFCLCSLSCNKESGLEPEEQSVQVFLKYGYKNELNTFEKTYQKDLVVDGVIKVNFWLTAGEQDSIIKQAESIEFFSMPGMFSYSPLDYIDVDINPNPGEQILRIKCGSNDKTVHWTYPVNENDSQVLALLSLKEFIVSIIESKIEYKVLPAPTGGYL